MSKHLKGAIAVQSLVLLAALTFLLGLFRFGLGAEHPLLNISLVLAGILTAALLLSVLWQRTLLREALVRRFYISPSWIYNHEIGYAPLSQVVPDGDAYGFVLFAANALARMSYGFEVAETPQAFEPVLIIDSPTFLFHTSGEESDDPDEGVVIDEWQGVLRPVESLSHGEQGLGEAVDFENAGDLAQLLQDSGILASLRDEGGDA